MNTICIGGEMIEVPPFYIQAESEYTKDELELFKSLVDASQREDARQVVLHKRVMFYELFKAGKITITKPVPKDSWFKRALNCLNN